MSLDGGSRQQERERGKERKSKQRKVEVVAYPRRMHAHPRIRSPKAEPAPDTLHHALEGPNVGGARNQADNVGRARVLAAELVGDVAAQAPRVVPVAVGARVGRRGRVDGGGDGAEADGHAVSREKEDGCQRLLLFCVGLLSWAGESGGRETRGLEKEGRGSPTS